MQALDEEAGSFDRQAQRLDQVLKAEPLIPIEDLGHDNDSIDRHNLQLSTKQDSGSNNLSIEAN